MKKQTKQTKGKEIIRQWRLIDVNDRVLGRITSEIAQLLIGKAKQNFVRNLDCGDYVVVINARNIKITGNKEKLKKYFRHSGYPGGFKEESFLELKKRKPEEIIKHAVSGMLPQNSLKRTMLKRLYIFKEAKHSYENKFSAKGELVQS